MKARTRLVVAALLFGAWMGWLAYLAATATRPVVLSRPQFLVATHYVVARLAADGSRPASSVHILEVHWPKEGDHWKDKELIIPNLPRCAGWQGPGDYILPLIKTEGGYEVAQIPPSPGYFASRAGPPESWRIYPRTPETTRQLQKIAGGRSLSSAG
jgi:hypothetical protein